MPAAVRDGDAAGNETAGVHATMQRDAAVHGEMQIYATRPATTMQPTMRPTYEPARGPANVPAVL